jgi:hypothetical protein
MTDYSSRCPNFLSLLCPENSIKKALVWVAMSVFHLLVVSVLIVRHQLWKINDIPVLAMSMVPLSFTGDVAFCIGSWDRLEESTAAKKRRQMKMCK